MIKDLERAVARIGALPDELQELAACLLDELAQNHGRPVYELTDEENALIAEAEAEADREEYASDADVDALFAKFIK